MSRPYQFNQFKHLDIFQKEIGYFLALSETLNISKAAESIGMQQPALSRALIRLENELGQKLFIRRSHGLSLTEAGLLFLNAIKNTKIVWEKNFSSLLSLSDQPSGLIKVGLHTSIGQKFLPKATLALTTMYPQIELEVQTMTSIQVARKIVDHEIDFGIVAASSLPPEIVSRSLGEDFLASYQVSQAQTGHLLFNPEMQMSNSLLKKISGLKKIAIKDYELVAKTAIETNYLALLPNTVAQNYPKLQQRSEALSKVRVSVIIHKDKLRQKAYKNLWNVIVHSHS